ncbi:MAG TPA: GNAT family N-acetyltransferase [Spirochaetota bacterium]|nr:GNAT family N-acetyltransferase [Spirochaetota bacterium]
MITIDRIAEGDGDALASLLEELSGDTVNRPLMRDQLRAVMADPAYILLGARSGEILAGTAMGIVCRDLVGGCRPFLVVENVVVSEERRGKGIGKALMAALEREAEERRCLYINIVSGMHRTGAHRFYESVGYPPDAARGFRKFLR